jgi:hypothetical protein
MTVSILFRIIFVDPFEYRILRATPTPRGFGLAFDGSPGFHHLHAGPKPSMTAEILVGGYSWDSYLYLLNVPFGSNEINCYFELGF